MLDLVLAVIHHLLIFSLFGVLMAEFVVVRPGMTNVMVERIAAIDLWYGALAALILAVGFGRVIFASKRLALLLPQCLLLGEDRRVRDYRASIRSTDVSLHQMA